MRQPGDAVVAQARIPIDRPPFNSCAGGGLKSGVGVRHSVEHTTDSERAVSHPSVSPGTEGRLSKDEYDARLDSALSARTYADLDQVVTDLPVAPATVVTTAAKTNGLAIASLACGLAQFAFGPLATIPAIVCGHMARSQIKRTGEQGAGLALAGLTLGRTAVILGILFIVLGLAISTGHAIMDTVNEVVRALDGSFSAEHGIGRLKPYMMPDWRGGAELELMRRIKDGDRPGGDHESGEAAAVVSRRCRAAADRRRRRVPPAEW